MRGGENVEEEWRREEEAGQEGGGRRERSKDLLAPGCLHQWPSPSLDLVLPCLHNQEASGEYDGLYCLLGNH
jgi:hypothetical protein